jgi:peptidoglycan/xylan/chitin deacetylase (PgdA/CDA1 family)
MLTWGEAKEMQASGLVAIGSHTMTHPILTQLARDKAREEIVRSKAVAENKLNCVVDLFAYPNGRAEDFDEEIIEMLISAGYSAACTTISGTADIKVNPYRLPRIDVTFDMCVGLCGRFSPEMFEDALTVKPIN